METCGEVVSCRLGDSGGDLGINWRAIKNPLDGSERATTFLLFID